MKQFTLVCAAFLFSFSIAAQAWDAGSAASSAGSSAAASATGAAGKTHPCSKDAVMLCPGMTPATGLYACMQSKASQVSPECKAKLKDYTKKP